jgi:RNA polymerase sigma-70 factor (ECF subfamily)
MRSWRQDPPDRQPVDADFEASALECLDALFSTALRLTRDRDAAEDLVQDTYLKAFRFASRFEQGSNLRAWLFTILYNTHRNARRDAGRNPIDADTDTVEQAAAPASDASTPEQALLRGTLSEDVRQALDALPEAFRQAVWHRDVEDLSYAEISQVLAVPPGTVMSRIARGRRQLFERLRARQ